MIYVGIDDTDTLETRGTNQLARQLARRLAVRVRCRMIVRHQLLEDPRVPCTSKNGSASLIFETSEEATLDWLIDEIRTIMKAEFIPGSDPGLCVARQVPSEIIDFGRRCKSSWIEQEEPRTLAVRHGLHLEGLGGTEGGVIGALAAVGLVASGNDGRIVQWGAWDDDLCGVHEAVAIRARAIEIRDLETASPIDAGFVDVGKHLRPNLRAAGAVLFVQPGDAAWGAVRLN